MPRVARRAAAVTAAAAAEASANSAFSSGESLSPRWNASTAVAQRELRLGQRDVGDELVSGERGGCRLGRGATACTAFATASAR